VSCSNLTAPATFKLTLLPMFLATSLLSLPVGAAVLQAEGEKPTEADSYRIVTVELPAELELEVSGMTLLPDGRPIMATRRGEVWIADNAYTEDGSGAEFTLAVDGLQEPLGLLVKDGWIWFVQRGEFSRMRDTNGDDKIDEIETVCDAWRISGNYHEYNFGPRVDHDGNFWITTNKPFGSQPFGKQFWRGFAMRITPEGEMIPTCSGLRSPAGIGMSPWGEAFYTDNQGEWCGASKLAHLEPGDFHGHPHGIDSTELPEWPYPPVRDVPDDTLMPEVEVPNFKLPAVWFPYDKMGKSPAGMVWDTSDGEFGPFSGQCFVADQHHASILRVQLEKVNGRWQGMCTPFREGFQCGVLRLAWGADGSLLAGQTNRGWGSRGRTTHGLERLEWTGVMPFELLEMHAQSDGFELVFTEPVDPEQAGDVSAYEMESYTYLLHAAYGSPEVERQTPEITSARVSEDGLRVRLVVDGLRRGFVHELRMPGVRAQDGRELLHDDAYYTLVEIPQ